MRRSAPARAPSHCGCSPSAATSRSLWRTSRERQGPGLGVLGLAGVGEDVYAVFVCRVCGRDVRGLDAVSAETDANPMPHLVAAVGLLRLFRHTVSTKWAPLQCELQCGARAIHIIHRFLVTYSQVLDLSCLDNDCTVGFQSVRLIAIQMLVPDLPAKRKSPVRGLVPGSAV
jgi:hypothetical protein